MSNETATLTCHACGRVVETKPTAGGGARLPRGWKRRADNAFCAACWKARFVLRAITMPIAWPDDAAERETLRGVLHEAWRQSTSLANWAVAELLRADATRTPDLDALPAMPRTYLYPGARTAVPAMDTSSVVALLQAVERRYRARRYHVLWLRREAPPSYRYPVPYPVHNQSWSVRETDGGALWLSVRLGGERREIRLRRGPGFRRQASAVRKLICGDAVAGELSIYERGPNVLAKMVMWLPRVSRQQERSGVLYVITGGDAMLTYRLNDGEARFLYADHVKRWTRSYERRRARLAHDTKAEKRPTKRRGRGIAETREAWARKHRDRMDSFCHETSAMIAKYAERQRVTQVVYDDTDKSYVAPFPWQKLRELLGYKLHERGIELASASGEVVTESAGAVDA